MGTNSQGIVFEPQEKLAVVLILAVAVSFLIQGVFDVFRNNYGAAAWHVSAGASIVSASLIAVRVRRSRQQDAADV